MLNSCFYSGSLEFCYMPDRGCLHDQPPIKTLGFESLMSFSDWHSLTHVVTTCCWGISRILCNSTGRGVLEACAWFLPDFTPCTFSLCWFCFVSSLQQLTEVSTILCWVLWVLPANCQTLGGLESSLLLSSVLILFWTPSIKVFLRVSMGSTGCTVQRSFLPLSSFWIKPLFPSFWITSFLCF